MTLAVKKLAAAHRCCQVIQDAVSLRNVVVFASLDLLFCPEILVGMSIQDRSGAPNSGADVQPDHIRFRLFGRVSRFLIIPIAVHLSSLFPSWWAVKTERGSRGVGFLSLFSRLHCAGQDARHEKPNLLPIRIQVSRRRTAILISPVSHKPKFPIINLLGSLSWLVARVDLHGNHTRRITQSAGNIDRKTGNSIRESGILIQIRVGRTSHV